MTPHGWGPAGRADEATPATLSITDFTLVRPSKRELQVLRHAESHVRALGLQLPAYTVEWFSPWDYLSDLPAGKTFDRLRPVRVLVMSERPDREVFSICCHELKHVADTRYPDLTVDEEEVRAEVFAELCVELCRLQCTGPVKRGSR